VALTFDQVSGLTHSIINEGLADNIYDSNPLFMHLKEKGRISLDGGDSIKLPITYKKLEAVGSFQNYGLLSTLPTESETAAEYDWKRYYCNIVISRHELLRNSGESAAVNLLRGKIRNGEMALEDAMATDLFSANADSATGILGLRQMVKASGLAGGINSSDFAGWASDIDATTSALVLSSMEQAYLDASIGQDAPDIIVTTKREFRRFWLKLQAVQRFGEGMKVNGGFQYLLFNGVPVFHDSHCPGTSNTADNHMFFLNSRWLYLFVHSDDAFKVERIGRIAEQDIVVNQVTTTVVFATDNRRMHSAMTTLKENP